MIIMTNFSFNWSKSFLFDKNMANPRKKARNPSFLNKCLNLIYIC